MAITPTTGGGLPPIPGQQPYSMQPNYSALNPNTRSSPFPFANQDYNSMMQNSLDYFMNPNSELMQQAKLRGMETANERGGVNSSIAAGAAQRASLDSATGMATGAVQAQLQQQNAQLQDWMDQQSFSRSLAAMPYQNSMDMLKYISQAGIQDPALYTPSVISGFSNFYNQNMNDILKQYFGGP